MFYYYSFSMYLGILLLVILSICIFIYHKITRIECFEPTTEIEPNQSVKIIVSRYNEKLSWTKKAPYNKYKYTIYNKGINDEFEKKNVSQVIKLPNVGRESHTYLYHIVNNYDNLADINVFLPGSIDTNHKVFKKNKFAKTLLSNIEKYNNAVFLSFGNIKDNDITKEFQNFKVDTYGSTNDENRKQNSEFAIRKSADRPFENWFQKNIGSDKVPYVIHYGIFSVSKKDIRQKPKSYYEKLLNLVSDHSNPEDGHYFEKSWGAIFYPFNNTHVILDPDIIDPFKGRY
jgi:hypothetical protein